MSIAAMTWAKRQRTGSPTRKLVLLTIADYASDEGRAWPSQATIANETELAVRSIHRALVGLEKQKLISREKRPPLPSGARQSDIITLNLTATGQNVRRPSPPDKMSASHRTLTTKVPDTESGKPSRNTPCQEEEQDLRELALRGGTPPRRSRSGQEATR